MASAIWAGRLQLLVLFLALGSGAVAADWSCNGEEPSCKSVFIVHDSWHAAIVLDKSDIPSDAMPELADFPDARAIEFSWGDQDYFPNPNSGVWAALRAAFWSTGSVLHLVGLNEDVATFYRRAEITELRLAPAAFDRMIAYIAQTFARAPPNDRAPASPGLFSYSRFYPATANFSLLRTCNAWVAEALESAGMPLSPRTVITAGNLVSQIAPYGKRR